MENQMKTKMLILMCTGAMLISACHSESQSPIYSPNDGLTQRTTSPTTPQDAVDSAPSSTADGGVDGGGGEPIRSTPEQVIRELKDLKQTQMDLFLRFANKLNFRHDESIYRADIQIKDPRVETVVRKMQSIRMPKIIETEDSFEIIEESKPMSGEITFLFNFAYQEIQLGIKKAQIKIEENRPCYHDGRPVPASTSSTLGSDICFSVPELQKISPTSLKTQLVSLLMHEMSHQFGADEETAQKIQKMVSIRLSFLNIIESNNDLRFLTGALYEVEKDGKENVNNFSAGLLGGSGALFSALASNDLIYGQSFKEEHLAYTAYPREDIIKALLSVHGTVHGAKNISDITVDSMRKIIPTLWVKDGLTNNHIDFVNNFTLSVDERTRNLVLDGYCTMVHNLMLEIWKKHDLEIGL